MTEHDGTGRTGGEPAPPAPFAAWVRGLRALTGLGRRDFAASLGVTHQAVWLWETGRAEARGPARLLLARYAARRRWPPPPAREARADAGERRRLDLRTNE